MECSLWTGKNFRNSRLGIFRRPNFYCEIYNMAFPWDFRKTRGYYYNFVSIGAKREPKGDSKKIRRADRRLKKVFFEDSFLLNGSFFKYMRSISTKKKIVKGSERVYSWPNQNCSQKSVVSNIMKVFGTPRPTFFSTRSSRTLRRIFRYRPALPFSPRVLK